MLTGDSVSVITTPPTLAFARRALTLDEALIGLRPLPLGPRVVPVSVVVQPVTVVANGFVGLEPLRSYLYATPPQEQGRVSSNAWADALAIHEYRHVEQLANLRVGLTRAAAAVFGDGGWSLLTGLSTPNWFHEGDAVYAETALTYAGRGRVAGFTALQRALALDSIRYPYAVARNGSLRRRVPDQYALGLALVAHGRHNFPTDPWPAVVRGAGTYGSVVYPFSLALKRATGLSTRRLYAAAYDSLATAWRTRAAARPRTAHRRITSPTRALTSYGSPLPQPDGTVLAERSSARRIPELVAIDTAGGERVLTTLGAGVDNSLHAAGGRAVWSRLRYTPHRPDETYSVVVVYDLATGRERVLGTRTQYFSPGLRADGAAVIAVEVTPDQPARLVTLDVADGTVTRALDYGFDHLAYPRFTADGHAAVAIAKRGSYIALWRLGLDDPTDVAQLTPWSRHTLGEPYVRDEAVFFSASYTGVNEVYRVPLDGSGAPEQLTAVAVDATAPGVAADGTLYFVEVDARGDALAALPEAQWLRRPVTIVEPVDRPEFAGFQPDSAGAVFRARYLDRTPPPTGTLPGDAERRAAEPGPDDDGAPTGLPYRKLLRGFRFYTVQPLVDQVSAQVSVVGANLLADVSARVTAGYNYNERAGYGDATLTVGRTYPWTGVTVGYAHRVSQFADFADTSRSPFRNVDFDELGVGLLLQAPLTQQRGAYQLGLQPRLGVERLAFSNASTDGLGLAGLTTAELAVRATRYRNRAPQEILPRYGQRAEVVVRKGFGAAAAQLRASAGVYLPGVVRTHGLYLELSGQREPITHRYQFPDNFAYARGYSAFPADGVWRASLDYHLPLWYPDLGALGIVYVRRLRAAVFADWSELRLAEQFVQRDYRERSVGVDLYADATFFNVQDLPLGLRFAYRLDEILGERAGWAGLQLLLRLPVQ